MTPAETFAFLEQTPPSGWDLAWHEMEPEAREELVKALDSLAIGITRAAGYFHARGLEQHHDYGVRISNQGVRKVAEFLGYAYPRSHEIRF